VKQMAIMTEILELILFSRIIQKPFMNSTFRSLLSSFVTLSYLKAKYRKILCSASYESLTVVSDIVVP